MSAQILSLEQKLNYSIYRDVRRCFNDELTPSNLLDNISFGDETLELINLFLQGSNGIIIDSKEDQSGMTFMRIRDSEDLKHFLKKHIQTQPVNEAEVRAHIDAFIREQMEFLQAKYDFDTERSK